MIITTFGRLNARNFFICLYLSFYEQLNFCGQLSWAWKKFYNLGVWVILTCFSGDKAGNILENATFN